MITLNNKQNVNFYREEVVYFISHMDSFNGSNSSRIRKQCLKGWVWVCIIELMGKDIDKNHNLLHGFGLPSQFIYYWNGDFFK